jgi:chaperonin cofactor prefoldin
MSERIYKNQLALDEAQRNERARVDTLQLRLQHVEAQHTMLTAEVNTLRQMVTQLLVARGNGPTTRNLP